MTVVRLGPLRWQVRDETGEPVGFPGRGWTHLTRRGAQRDLVAWQAARGTGVRS